MSQGGPSPAVEMESIDGSVEQPPAILPRPGAGSSRVESKRAHTEYKSAIYAHSRREALLSNFSGRNYVPLADWLIRPTPPSLSTPPDGHKLIVIHRLGENGPNRVQTITVTDPVDLTPPESQPTSQGKGCLVFVRGFPSPSWVAELGSRYRVDPEYFYRHLDFFDSDLLFQSHGSCFNRPSLLSTSNNIIHIPVMTILTETGVYPGWEVYANSTHRRSWLVKQVSLYRRTFRSSARCGDSTVREYSVLSNRHSVMEQRISVCITDDGPGWVALICMDIGRDLEKSPTGPWFQRLDGKPVVRLTPLPVVQHHPNMVWRKMGDISSPLPSRQAPSSSVEPDAMPELPQSISTLPLKYQSLLSSLDLSEKAKSDPLHALVPIFAHSAFSEVAFLNLVHEQIDKMTEPVGLGVFHAETFELLQQFEVVLERHATQIRECIRSIHALRDRWSQSRMDNMSSSKSPGPASHHTSFSVAGILQDHENLLERCLYLLSRVHSAKNTEMNRAMLLESKRAIEQSERMKKLTLLATYFIPLTFTASLFGMNFDVLGQSELPVWWYLVFAAPFTILTHVFHTWDVPDIISKSKTKVDAFNQRRHEAFFKRGEHSHGRDAE
ncbi:hypothetical protein QBC34DRAFT_213421 [Podospora aff. communis PSN243]|uniref:Uncharacterized protein n=1 Tax=Podospora aff. communis PSN243 TaxID=3040156 RepID=A0AAV9G577_9PEZI|nr:hypothetical protein QBC34DRAFT_213421 [Podospora aff. communis PSN243]